MIPTKKLMFFSDTTKFLHDLIDNVPLPGPVCWSCRQFKPEVTSFHVSKDLATLELGFDNLPSEIGLCADHSVLYMNSFNRAHASMTGSTQTHQWTKEEWREFLKTRPQPDQSYRQEGAQHENQ